MSINLEMKIKERVMIHFILILSHSLYTVDMA
jgi:hypothetical protein